MKRTPTILVNGYKNHSYYNTVDVLSSIVYSYSTAKVEEFHSMLADVYSRNSNTKMLLDYVANWVLEGNDLIIMYGASTGTGLYGFYDTSAKDVMLPNHRLLSFNAFVADEKQILATIAHEAAHLLADLLFKNDANPYAEDDNSAMELFHTASKAMLYNTYKLLDGSNCEPIYDGLSIDELVKLNYYEYLQFAKQTDIPADLKEFLEELAVLQLYPTDQVDGELFVRLFEFQVHFADSEILPKLLSPFKEYVDSVLNPKLAEKGFEYEFAEKEFNSMEELYFAIHDGEQRIAEAIYASMDSESENVLVFGADFSSNIESYV